MGLRRQMTARIG